MDTQNGLMNEQLTFLRWFQMWGRKLHPEFEWLARKPDDPLRQFTPYNVRIKARQIRPRHTWIQDDSVIIPIENQPRYGRQPWPVFEPYARGIIIEMPWEFALDLMATPAHTKPKAFQVIFRAAIKAASLVVEGYPYPTYYLNMYTEGLQELLAQPSI